MTRAGWLAAAALAGSIVAGGWYGATRLGATAPSRTKAATPAARPTPAPTPAAPVVEDVGAASGAGATPMGERVAVVGFLNKRNGQSRELVMKPGQAYRVGDAIIRLRACEKTAPWEQDQLTGAFLQLDVRGTDQRWRRAFSGWVFKERPALNVVQSGLYDVWPKSCTMRFPATGPDTVSASAGSAAPARSRASNDPSTTAEPESSPPAEGPSAAPSNAL